MPPHLNSVVAPYTVPSDFEEQWLGLSVICYRPNLNPHSLIP